MRGEDVEELDFLRDALALLLVAEGRQPVDEAADDALHIDVLVQLRARLQERGERLQVELVGEHLPTNNIK